MKNILTLRIILPYDVLMGSKERKRRKFRWSPDAPQTTAHGDIISTSVQMDPRQSRFYQGKISFDRRPRSLQDNIAAAHGLNFGHITREADKKSIDEGTEAMSRLRAIFGGAPHNFYEDH